MRKEVGRRGRSKLWEVDDNSKLGDVDESGTLPQLKELRVKRGLASWVEASTGDDTGRRPVLAAVSARQTPGGK